MIAIESRTRWRPLCLNSWFPTPAGDSHRARTRPCSPRHT